MIWQILKKKIDGVDAEPQLLQVFRRTDPGIQQRTLAVQVQAQRQQNLGDDLRGEEH